MYTPGRLTLLLLSTFLLCSCNLPLLRGTPPGIPPEAMTRLSGTELSPPPDLLKYYDWLQEQPKNAQRREYDISRDNFDAEPSALNRLRLALVLCLPEASFRDYGTARTMMEEYLRDAADERAGDRGLAHLILGFTGQNAQAQHQRAVAEQQMKTAEESRGTLEDRVKELEITVEQLKAIEEGLMETEQSINVPAAPATGDD